MALPPVSDLQAEIQSTDSASFAAKWPQQDVVVLEPNEPGRDYTQDLHGLASYVFLPRAQNQPVPVGRDARAVVLLDHAAVSRLHMVMAWTGTAWQFMDRSSNGVFLHDQRVPKEQPTTLSYGTPIRLGKALMLRVFTPEGLHDLFTAVHSPQVATPGGWDAEGGFDGAWGAPLTPQDPFKVGAGAYTPPPTPPPPPSFDAPPAPDFGTAPPSSGFGAAPPPPDFGTAPPQPVRPVTEEFELDFDFADAPVDGEFVGEGYDVEATEPSGIPGAPPAPPVPPTPPAPPSTPPPPVPDDISFDFDFGASDGRGGFA